MRITRSAKFKVFPAQAASAATLACMLLAGCGMNTGAGTGSGGGGTTPLAVYQGKVFGGQQPVNGATIQLYTVGTTGTATASTPLISSTVKSSNGGQFSLTAAGVPLFSCTSATQVYIVATGGDASSGPNANLSLMAALGPCSGITSSTFININELTTVAAVYALAPFMADVAHVGANGSNPAGLVHAFQAANLLVSSATGLAPTPPVGMTLPTTEINTLADILATCVNTAGAGSPGCNAVFGATGASDTLAAGLAIAKNPGKAANVALWSLPAGDSPFIPKLSAQPNDFTVAVNYAGTELASPYGVAIDATGNAWVTNEAGRSVVKLPSLATTFATTTYSNGGLLAPRGISIDRNGNIWIANTGGNDVVELNGTTGIAMSGAGYTTGGVSAPVAIANDSTGSAWVANFNGNSITQLSPTGTASGASPIGIGTLTTPTSIALDATGRVAVANAGSGQLCLFSNAAVLQSCLGDGTLFGAMAVAVSSGGNVSLAGSTTGATVSGAFTLATSTGVVNGASPVSGGGLALPVAVAYDGNGIAWFANAGSISEFSGTTPTSPSTGFGSVNSPAGIAVDSSGNIWTANSGDNSVSIFIGLGSAVATPIAMNVGP